jgi:Arc/MetJ-type ribon-helix-helix transcriptional regulator
MTEADTDPLEETVEITLRVPTRIVREIDREVAGGRHLSREEGLRALIVDRWQRRGGIGRWTDAGRVISVPAPRTGAGAAEQERTEPPPAS